MDPQKALSQITPLSKIHRDLLHGLKEYVPGLRPDLAIFNDSRFLHNGANGPAKGWAVTPNEQLSTEHPQKDTIISIAATRDPLAQIKTIVHEVFHQGDPELGTGAIALKLLLGHSNGEKLDFILIEGYTELRARETMLRLFRHGYQGKNAISKRVATLAQKASKQLTLAKTWAWMRLQWSTHPFTPFVQLVRTWINRSGRRQGFDAYVQQGEIAGLVEDIGLKRLQFLGALAGAPRLPDTTEELPEDLSELPDPTEELPEDLSGLPDPTELPEDLSWLSDPITMGSIVGPIAGLDKWLISKMQQVLTDKINDWEEIRNVQAVARAFLEEVRQILVSLPPAKRANRAKAFVDMNFEAWLTRGDTPQSLQAAIRQELAQRSNTHKSSWIRKDYVLLAAISVPLALLGIGMVFDEMAVIPFLGLLSIGSALIWLVAVQLLIAIPAAMKNPSRLL